MGSPPHTRERRDYGVIMTSFDRITPAYAGKTKLLPISHQIQWDHPRIRGKDSYIYKDIYIISGSPPHTRERRLHPLHSQALGWDHPRIRGKDFNMRLKLTVDWGSPPHTRERLIKCKSDMYYLRITPAYAGKTAGRPRFQCSARDHPRIRGKDIFASSLIVLSRGSPPHTRERLCSMSYD